MKKAKAILSILLVLAMAFSLLACSKTATPVTTTSTASASAAAPAASAATPAASAATPAASAATPAASAAAPATKTIDSITIGVSGLLGRFLAGLSPAESKTGCDAIFDSVWRVDPKTKQFFSDILESWTWTDDTTLVLKMKQNIFFNNGDNATADDLIFSYTNHKDRGSNFTNLMPVLWDQCVATDKYTATFKFSKAYPDFPNKVIFLIDKAWSQKVGWDSQDWYNKPVGSGPYKVTEYVSDDHFTLQARDDYWNKDAGPIAVKQWIIKYYPDPSTMYMDLETGNIQLCDVDSQDYSRFLKDGGNGFKCSLLPAGVVTYLSFGFLDNPIWKDQKLRQAIAYCADWDKVGQIVYGDQYVKATSMAPKDSPQYFNPGKVEYNPDKAKQLLSDAGYGPDNPLKLTTFMMDTPEFKNFCESFQSYAKNVGIQIDIQYGDVSSALAKWLDPSYRIDFGFLFNNLGSTTFSLYDGLNGTDMKPGVTFAYVDDPDYQKFMADLVVNRDQDQIMKDSKDIQQLIFDKTLLIPISELQTTLGYRLNTFSDEQVKDYSLAAGNYQIGRLGMASAWK